MYQTCHTSSATDDHTPGSVEEDKITSLHQTLLKVVMEEMRKMMEDRAPEQTADHDMIRKVAMAALGDTLASRYKTDIDLDLTNV